MKNIRIIETGIDVSGIVRQLEERPQDWGSQKKIEDTGDLVKDRNFPYIDVSVLQLIMGGVNDSSEFVGDTEICIPTPVAQYHTEVFKTLSKWFTGCSRCGFLALPVGKKVGLHVDVGNYYLTRDRYHLSIQGRYKYTVGDESVIVEPGTLLWFNNKEMHGTENVGDVTRITFVFDVPHAPENP